MRKLLFTVFLFVVAGTAVAAQISRPVADRVATQNAIFEEQLESDLRHQPERATSFGDYRYNDKLDEYSLEALAQRHKTDQGFLARLKAISTAEFSEQELMYLTSAIASINVWNRFGAAYRWTPPQRQTKAGAAA